MIEKILSMFREIGNIQFSSFSKPLIAVEDAIKIVQEVAKEYDWIPVSERLPEPFQRVLVYDVWDDSMTIEYLQENDSFIPTVVAWMPLPTAPYHKGE